MIFASLPANTGLLCGVGYIIVLCLSLSVRDSRFLRQVLKHSFCYVLTPSQEEKPCKCGVRKWEWLLSCPEGSLSLPVITQELPVL